MFLKIIIFIIAVYFIYVAFFRRQPLSKKREDGENDADTMVECASCKTFVSVSDAIKKGGRYFCCTECFKKEMSC
ncbi:MAG: hypothetical protein LBS73_06530 [Campylobacteraceae bacterium]|jgi:uncharacterized protein|nr:hypothetical protein [Campylobacteraceae bacterium]